jgi:hypothetical protein
VQSEIPVSLIMTQETVHLNKSSITFDEHQLAHLHIKEGQVVELEEVQGIFSIINQAFTGKRFRLLVTAGENATLSPDARSYASSAASSNVIAADAIVVNNYSHEMTANFFIRFNKPHRPTNWFKNREEALEWLKTFEV